jgi:hypothetical protein
VTIEGGRMSWRFRRGEVIQTTASTPSLRNRIPRRAPSIAFALYAAISIILILFVFGRSRWFFGDEFDFLAQRNGGNLGDLFQSHGEHWTTLPLIEYRVLWNVFGLRTYLPYQVVVAVAHVTTAFLLRVVMRRAGVRSWTATVVAASFLLFAPGQENILWAFQITFVGAVMFGLIQLILSDHDGPLDRRDFVGLAAGLASLMFSGVALPMVAAVGIATLARRGVKAATFHVAPLAAVYAVWFFVTDPGGIDNPYDRSATVREVARFVWSGVRGAFVAVGGFGVIGIILAVALVVGGAIVWFSDRERARLAAPVALLAGALLFLVGTSVTRWFISQTADTQSRYIYTLSALLLPALAVALDAIMRRWRLLTPVLVGLLLVACVKNATSFDDTVFDAQYFRSDKQLVLATARSPFGARVPGSTKPSVWYSIGWLRAAAANGDLPAFPERPTPPALERHIQTLLSVTQMNDSLRDATCRTYRRPVVLRPAEGERFTFDFGDRPKVGANFFLQDTVAVTTLGATGEPVDRIGFKSDFGHTLQAVAPNLVLSLAAGDTDQSLILCTRSR